MPLTSNLTRPFYPFAAASLTKVAEAPQNVDVPPIDRAVATLHGELSQVVRNLPIVGVSIPEKIDACALSISSVRVALHAARGILAQLRRERSGGHFYIDPGEMMCIFYINSEVCRWRVEVQRRVTGNTSWMLDGLEAAWQEWHHEAQQYQHHVRECCTSYANNMHTRRYSYASGDNEALYRRWLNTEDRARFRLLEGSSEQGEYDAIVARLDQCLSRERSLHACEECMALAPQATRTSTSQGQWDIGASSQGQWDAGTSSPASEMASPPPPPPPASSSSWSTAYAPDGSGSD